MTLTLIRPNLVEYRDELFEDDLIVEMRLAELVIALSGCSAKQAFRVVRKRGAEKPLERLVRALAAVRSEIATAN